MPIIDAALGKRLAQLLIIDPIQSYLGSGVDLYRSDETRPVLDGLAKPAERHNCAVLLLCHLSKQSGGKAIHRGLGSIDLTGAVRSELLADALPDDPSARALVRPDGVILGLSGVWRVKNDRHMTAFVTYGTVEGAPKSLKQRQPVWS